MKRIKLTQGKFALVDDDDYLWLNQFKWCVSKRRHLFTAVRRLPDSAKGVRGKLILMHHALMNDKPIDHINGNPLDNRRSNLRVCTQSENACNRGPRVDNTSGFKGVSLCSRAKKWVMEIQFKGKRIRKRFLTKQEAIEAYKKAAIELHGEFAKW